MSELTSMDPFKGEQIIQGRMQKYLKTVDTLLVSSSISRRVAIAGCFAGKFGGTTESMLNPFWDPKLFALYAGQDINYASAEIALFVTHRSIINLKVGTKPKPYDPKERTVNLKQIKVLLDIAPYAIQYVVDMALLRQLRKGIVWDTVTGQKEVSFETNYNENAVSFESHVRIPKELEKSLESYENRKVQNNLAIFWSSDISSTNLKNAIGLFLAHKKEIEKYYEYPLITIFTFFWALGYLCEDLCNGPFTKDYIGLQFTKKALIDKLAFDRRDGYTRFENALQNCENILGKTNNKYKKNLQMKQELICNNILKKYSETFRRLPELKEFFGTANLLIETQPDVYLLIYYAFKNFGGTILEKPLRVLGQWKSFRGKAFENYCHITIEQEHSLKTFRKKIKDSSGRIIGDIDLGVFSPPYLFVCECKDYKVNVKFLMGEVQAVLQRIQDGKHGYLSWLSKLDENCKRFSQQFISDLISKQGLDPNSFQYLVPVIVTWRPEFILNTSSEMLDDNIPRVCTLSELSKILRRIPSDLRKKQFVLKL